MATKFVKAALILAAGAASMVSTSAHAAGATATARAKILKQVTVTNTSDLQFGTIVKAPGTATVSIDSTGARTCGAGLTCTGTTSAADFGVGGTVGEVVTVSSDATVSMTNGAGGNMTATLTPSATTLTLGALTAGYNGTFSVGGALTIAAAQADGVYSGTFNVTVNYQ